MKITKNVREKGKQQRGGWYRKSSYALETFNGTGER